MFYNDNKKVEYVQIRISKKDKSRLKDFAKCEGLSITDFILKAIDFYIKNSTK